MSTRSTTHFIHGNEANPTAIIYRHSDGYPEAAGVDLRKFLEECAKLSDPRFTDPSYLAAKYVVFLADLFNNTWDWKTGKEVRYESKLEFLSVGVMSSDPSDIEYRYIVDCGTIVDGRPVIRCYAVSMDWKTGTETQKKKVEIPALEKEETK
jgi:hypothetical protein